MIVQALFVGGISLSIVCGCKSEKDTSTLISGSESKPAGSTLKCAQSEQTDYRIYRLTDDAVRIGDVMPYFDSESKEFNVFFLKDIWNDATHKRHPWYGLKTKNFYQYSSLSQGEILSCSTQPCNQDYALGTGAIIKRNSTFYAFYTGHNPNYPSGCVSSKEGIMLATSSSLNSNFTKNSSFNTLYAPVGEGYDQNDNFRDPYVIYDEATAKYYMIISARKNLNGTWKGVVAYYTSIDLTGWTYEGVLYDGGPDNFFMLETAEIFKSGSMYYLLFSDINSKHVYYRTSSSITGPWNKPIGPDRFDGKGIYAAKTAIDDVGDRYIFGWTYAQENNSDAGAAKWGGNLVAHKIFPKANGDLAVAIPHTQKAYLENRTHAINKTSQSGNVSTTLAGTHSYNLASPASFDIANVIFDPINLGVYKINATVSYSASAKDFGFMIGACDGTNDFYSLRFVPAQNRFSLDKTSRSLITTSTVAATDVPLALSPNTNYNVQIVIENSMLIAYVNNEVALSTRIYRASNTNWGVFSDNSNATFTNILVNKP